MVGTYYRPITMHEKMFQIEKVVFFYLFNDTITVYPALKAKAEVSTKTIFLTYFEAPVLKYLKSGFFRPRTQFTLKST